MYNGPSLTPDDFYTIREISTYWSLKCPRILVKILSKKRVLNYGKPSKNDKWPLKVHNILMINGLYRYIIYS